MRALATVVRTPRHPTRVRSWPIKRLVATVVAAAAAAAILMAFVDAWGITDNASILTLFIFDKITGFGRSGWFLFPSAAALFAIAILAPALPRWSQQVAASLAVRFGFIFAAIAIPGLFGTIVKRVIGRARPYVGDTIDPFLFHPGVWRSEY